MRYVLALFVLLFPVLAKPDPLEYGHSAEAVSTIYGGAIAEEGWPIPETDLPLFSSVVPFAGGGYSPCEFYDEGSATVKALGDFSTLSESLLCVGAQGTPGFGRWVSTGSPGYDPNLYRMGVVVASAAFAPVRYEDVLGVYPCLVCEDLCFAPGALTPALPIEHTVCLY